MSDLLYCLRQKTFERLSDDPHTMNKKSEVGELMHRRLGEILGEDFEYEREIIWDKEGLPIVMHADAVAKRDGAIIEFKTASRVP